MTPLSNLTRRSSDMHAQTRHAPAAALHDYPPVDKPDRLPLRQRWHTTGGEGVRFQDATDASKPARPPRFRVLVDGSCGGQLRALNETALAQARDLVRRYQRGHVVFDEPAVHTYVDEVLQVEMEPLMFIRINAPRTRWSPLVQELRGRRAKLHEVELQPQVAVLRAEAPLRRLLGLERAITELGEVPPIQAFVWLLRYEPSAGWGAVDGMRRGTERGGGA